MKLSRGTRMSPLAGRLAVTCGCAATGTPASISKLSKVTVIGPMSFLCSAISPARPAEVKNFALSAPLSTKVLLILTKAPPLTAK